MSDLKLDSLRIQNFRAFSDLQIEQLGRVNLIVGKNNTGKTSLLEAIQLYVCLNTRQVVSDVIRKRDLNALDASRRRSTSEFGVRLPSVRHLIHGYPQLSTLAQGDELSGVPEIKITSTPESNRELVVRLSFPQNARDVNFDAYVDGDRTDHSVFGDEKVKGVFLRSLIDASDVDAGKIWDRIELTPQEDLIVSALQIVEPDIVDVAVKSKNPEEGAERIAIARRRGEQQPESLKNLGEGMNRLLELSLALVDAEDGVLLIDEVENGLHHTVHGDVWKLIFETARDLNVQVFATTHSYDALKAFEKVANEHEDEEGMLVQLRRRRVEPYDIAAVTADEEKLRDALHAHVDPR